MKVYIRQNAKREFITVNGAVAYDGFRKLGWEIIPFSDDEDLSDLQPDEVVVGCINHVHQALLKLGITPPDEVNYPEESNDFLDRKIWRSQTNSSDYGRYSFYRCK